MKSIKSINCMGYIIIAYCFVAIIYSYIAEFQKYKLFLESILYGNIWDVLIYSAESFLHHKNIYGMLLLVGIIFCIIVHSINKKWWCYLIAAFLYINMFFTYCKSSLAIALVLLVIYAFYRLIIYIKINKVASIVSLSIISAIIISVGTICLISYFSKGAFIERLYIFLSASTHRYTINSRELIWKNTFSLIEQTSPLSYFFGRGYGVINEMLLPMNGVNGDETTQIHSSYITVFAEGGVIYFLAYLSLLGFASYKMFMCFRKIIPVSIGVCLGFLAFVVYTTIESIHYYVYMMVFFILALDNILKTQEKGTEDPNNIPA